MRQARVWCCKLLWQSANHALTQAAPPPPPEKHKRVCVEVAACAAPTSPHTLFSCSLGGQCASCHSHSAALMVSMVCTPSSSWYRATRSCSSVCGLIGGGGGGWNGCGCGCQAAIRSMQLGGSCSRLGACARTQCVRVCVCGEGRAALAAPSPSRAPWAKHHNNPAAPPGPSTTTPQPRPLGQAPQHTLGLRSSM
jgi:hypothetical protein